MWRGYLNLENLGYEHHTINHSENFVNPNNLNTHTQNIESKWSKIKRDMRRRYGKITSHDGIMLEYL